MAPWQQRISGSGHRSRYKPGGKCWRERPSPPRAKVMAPRMSAAKGMPEDRRGEASPCHRPEARYEKGEKGDPRLESRRPCLRREKNVVFACGPVCLAISDPIKNNSKCPPAFGRAPSKGGCRCRCYCSCQRQACPSAGAPPRPVPTRLRSLLPSRGACVALRTPFAPPHQAVGGTCASATMSASRCSRASRSPS